MSNPNPPHPKRYTVIDVDDEDDNNENGVEDDVTSGDGMNHNGTARISNNIPIGRLVLDNERDGNLPTTTAAAAAADSRGSPSPRAEVIGTRY
jgi:hypothetical protein